MIGFFSSSGFSFLYRVGGKGTKISGDSRSVGRYHMYDSPTDFDIKIHMKASGQNSQTRF